MVRRVLGHLARTTIAAFPLGPGTTVGRINGVGHPLVSPLSGEPCVGYEVDVSWLDDDRWLPLLREWNCSSFDLEDQTGGARGDANLGGNCRQRFAHNIWRGGHCGQVGRVEPGGFQNVRRPSPLFQVEQIHA